MFSLLKIKSFFVIGGAALLSFLALYLKLQYVESKRDKAEVRVETLKAQLHSERMRKKIIKESKEKYVSRTAEIAAQLEKKDEEFTGIDVLTNPNDRD